MARNSTSYKFYFHKLYKSWRKGKASSTVSYQTCIQDPNLCVVGALDEYIFSTEGWRSGEESSLIFVSFVNPRKLVVSSTISGRLKNVLRKAGIDIGTFKTHSPRSVSTSKAYLSSAPIEEILKRGCWSNKSAW